jgi:serine/threonine protein kinase
MLGDAAADGLLAGRYRLGEVLGGGGMAEVRRATDVRLRREVAVKLFRAGSDPTARRRFDDEALLLAGLSHPGLVSVYDAGVADGRPFLVMQLVAGRTLRDRIAAGPLPPAEVRALAAPLCATLGYVHGRRVVHRDIKPSNILLDRAGQPFLADFGISQLVGAARLTTTGQLMGTAGYLAPEQVSGGVVTAACDVYALGLVLLECLTGRPEYAGPDVEAALARLSRPPVLPAWLPPDLAELLAGMTEADPARRLTADRCAALLRATTPLTAPVPAAVPVAASVTGPQHTRLLTAIPDTPEESTAVLPAVDTAPPARRRWNRLYLGAAAGVVAVAGLGTAVALTSPNRPSSGPGAPTGTVSATHAQPAVAPPTTTTTTRHTQPKRGGEHKPPHGGHGGDNG